MALLGYAVLSLLAYSLISAIVQYRKLRHFKGPLFASLSEFWLFWECWNGRINTSEHDVLKQYGDADVVRHIAASGSRWRRAGWYEALKVDPRMNTVFSVRDEKTHADLKAKEIGAYNGRDVDSFEPDIDARLLDLLALIRKSYQGKVMDFSKVARYFTLDVLSTLAFGGKPFGFMQANADLWDYNKLSSQFLPIFQVIAHHSRVRNFFYLPIIRDIVAPKHTDQGGVGPLMAFARKAVEERLAEGAEVKNDMLGHFIRKGLSPKQCEAESFLQIIAGSDSTTGVLRATMFFLLGNPVAYGKLRAEIDEAVHEGKVLDPVAKYAEIQKLPYLSACIWEGIRMFPPLVDLKAKLSPPEGDTIKGFFIPGGTEVALCDEATTRNAAVFGEDTNLYRPERWIEADADSKAKYYQVVDTVFGAGRWYCMGRAIAFMELHKTFFELLKNFNWQIVDPMKGIKQRCHGIYDQSDMNVVATPRG